MDLIKPSRIISRTLDFVGIWPTTNSTLAKKWKYYARLRPWLLQGPLTYTFVGLMFLELIFSPDMDHATNVSYMLLTEIGLVVKIVTFRKYGHLAVSMLHEWEHSPLFALRNADEHEMWERSQKRFTLLLKFYLICCMASSLGVVGGEMFVRSYQLPFAIWLPVNLTVARNYWCVYGYELLAHPWTCVSNVMMDMFFWYLTLHLSLTIKLVGMRLQRVFDDGTADEAEFHDRLVEVIQFHRRVRKLAMDCERVISFPIAFQIFLSTFVLCFIAYRLSMMSILDDLNGFAGVMEYIVAMGLEIYLLCYYANEITLATEDLTSCLYKSNWVTLSARNRHLILVYMEYLKRPLVLHASHFFDIGLPLFSKVINNAYSLFALLLNMRD